MTFCFLIFSNLINTVIVVFLFVTLLSPLITSGSSAIPVTVPFNTPSDTVLSAMMKMLSVITLFLINSVNCSFIPGSENPLLSSKIGIAIVLIPSGGLFPLKLYTPQE